MREKPYAKEGYWVCPNHIPSLKLPYVCAKCYYSNCGSERPSPLLGSPEVVQGGNPSLSSQVRDSDREDPECVTACAWFTCKNEITPRVGGGGEKKYCSRYCQTKGAHYRAKEKRKHLRVSA